MPVFSRIHVLFQRNEQILVCLQEDTTRIIILFVCLCVVPFASNLNELFGIFMKFKVHIHFWASTPKSRSTSVFGSVFGPIFGPAKQLPGRALLHDQARNALDVSKSPFRIYLKKFNNHSELYFSGCVGFVCLFMLPCHT